MCCVENWGPGGIELYFYGICAQIDDGRLIKGTGRVNSRLPPVLRTVKSVQASHILHSKVHKYILCRSDRTDE